MAVATAVLLHIAMFAVSHLTGTILLLMGIHLSYELLKDTVSFHLFSLAWTLRTLAAPGHWRTDHRACMIKSFNCFSCVFGLSSCGITCFKGVAFLYFHVHQNSFIFLIWFAGIKIKSMNWSNMDRHLCGTSRF